MKTFRLLFLIFLAAGLLVINTFSATNGTEEQSTEPVIRPGSEIIDMLRDSTTKEEVSGEEVSAYLPKVWCSDIDDETTRAVCWEAYQAGLSYYQTGLSHRTRVFGWQHVSTIIIFVVVLLMVATGIYFAWIQFKRDMDSAKSSSGDASEHTVELSTTGVKVSSPVLGVIILALSLAFFYLYLVYVYPIEEIF